MEKALGIDIGGSGIKGAPVDLKKGILLEERHRIPTPQPATPEAVAETVGELVKHFSWKGKIGCGFPAAIQHGIVRTASNIDKSWIGIDAISLFEQSTQCKVKIVNDADAAALAEMEFGSGKDHKGMVIIVTVGTGIGTALFNNGQLFPNAELGHIYMPNGDKAELKTSDAARKREDLSWKKWAKQFNVYLGELDRLLWPDRIIIGGGASKKFEKFEDYLSINADVIPAQFLNEAGIIGAALASRVTL